MQNTVQYKIRKSPTLRYLVYQLSEIQRFWTHLEKKTYSSLTRTILNWYPDMDFDTNRPKSEANLRNYTQGALQIVVCVPWGWGLGGGWGRNSC